MEQPRMSADSDTKKVGAVATVSGIAIGVIVVIIIIVVAAVVMLIKFLRRVVDGAGKLAPTFECAAWMTARQQNLLAGGTPAVNPDTGAPYTVCEATHAAIAATQLADGPCPIKTTPPAVEAQSPYVYYLAAQQCGGA